MPIRIIVHIHNEDPFLAEVDELPDPKDNFIVIRHPRKRDGKALTFVTDGATSFLYPWARISFLEVMDETQGHDSVLGFFREEGRANHL